MAERYRIGRISDYFTRFLGNLVGFVCIGCDRVHSEPWPWCCACAEALPWVKKGSSCVRCGGVRKGGREEEEVCEQCLVNPPLFSAARAAFWYAPPVDRWVQRLKFGRELSYGTALGLAIGKHIEPYGELVVPVPLSASRLRMRGFNQAAVIAAAAAEWWRLPVKERVLQRVRATEMQAQLDQKAREANVAGAFVISTPAAVRGKRVILVDDVLTTGATVRAAASVLLEGGARGVEVVVAARARGAPRG
ncbi:MAG: ComF family protein [Hydrogenophilus sp.]|nr:ComF family protein [Hydrogenophilus sp.]